MGCVYKTVVKNLDLCIINEGVGKQRQCDWIFIPEEKPIFLNHSQISDIDIYQTK